MSIFFDQRVSAPPSAGGRTYLDIKWHQVYPLLALTVDDDKKGGLVCIYDNQKDDTCIDIDLNTRLGVQVCCTAWHPKEPLLGIGFESGEVTIWNHLENESFEGVKNHIASVVMLSWSHCGNILVSADSLGCLVVWAANSQGHVQPKATHDFRDAVCQIVFRKSGAEGPFAEMERSLGKMTSWRPKTGRREAANRHRGRPTDKQNSDERSFFVGLLNGAIFYLKENGASEEVLTSGSSVKWLLYHQAREILIVMTEAAILGQFSVDANGGLSEMNKIKLSGRGDVQLSWVGVGVLGIISEDLSLRLWDVDSGDNHVLVPKGGNYSGDEYMSSVDYNAKTGFLCCNTNKGKLIVWREIKSKDALNLNTMKKGNEEDRWEWFCTFPIASNSRSVKWCPSVPDVLAINAVREMFVLRQQDICATFYNKVNIIQSLASQLSIFAVEDDLKTELNTDIQIKGFTNTKSHICVWDGARVEVYELGIQFQPNYFNLAGKFADKSEIIYMFEKSLFLLEPQQIQIRSFQGILKQTLTFSTNEGYPINFTGSGEYITATTMNGYLKIWHVGQREAKPHVPAKDIGKSVKGFGEIIQAKNNFEGTKVAFTIAKKNLVPDSRLLVWDIQSDTIVHLDTPKMFVANIFWETEDSFYLSIELKVIPEDLQSSETSDLLNKKLVDSTETENRIMETTTNQYVLINSKRISKERLRRQYLRQLEKNDDVQLSVEKLKENMYMSLREMRNDLEYEDIEPWILIENNDPSVLLSASSANNSRVATARSSRSGSLQLDLDLNDRPSTSDSIDSGVLSSSSSSSNFVKGYKKPMRTSRKSTVVEKLKESESLEYFQKEKALLSHGQKTSILGTDSNIKLTEDSVLNNKEKNKTKRKEEIPYVSSPNENEEIPSNQIRTLFICPQKGILTHEKIEKDESIDTLLGLDVPYWYCLSKCVNPTGKYFRKNQTESFGKSNVKIQRHQILDFKGVEVTSSDKKEAKQIKKALLSYVYHNLSGDVDKALLAMGDIRSDEIWKNMARLCLKSKRVDVASVCFAKMLNAGATMALRLSRERGDELDAQIAMVALQLNMLVSKDEAEKLYRSSGRYDLLLNAYISYEKFPDAVELCEKHCRIQLRTTYYTYAQKLEEEGNIEEAIEMYENSGNHRFEVPRMLINLGELKRLEEYVDQKKDKELYKQWAQHLEASGDTKGALEYYELALAWLDVTRILIYSCDDLNRAMVVAETVKDRASCHKIGEVLLECDAIEKAVEFYTKAEAFGPAMRVCRQNGMDDKLWFLANFGETTDKLEAARYYETKDPPDYEKAILLYHRSGYGSKAMDLAFVTQEFTALQEVAKDLIGNEGTKADPEMLKRCADFFVVNGQYDRALEMYVVAKKYVEAMDVCVEHKIPITEKMAEKLTAPKGDGIDVVERNRLLEKMAECCMLQGNYHLSAKKFTEAGNKIAAMKALLKSGDTERIIFYANVSRHRDIYLMAANYLQTTQWQNSPQTIDQIITMYTKAKSPESIGSFYEAWSQSNFEIEKDYEKSLDNLKRAAEVFKDLLQKDGGVRSYEVRLNKIYAKIGNVNAFLGLREMMKISPMEAVEKLRLLLQEKNIEACVSRGDIYSLLIEYYTNQEDFESAIETLMELRREIPVPPSKFLKNETLQALNRALGTRTSRDFSGLNSASSKPGTRSGSTAHHQPDFGGETQQPESFTFTGGASHHVNDLGYEDEGDALEEVEDLDDENVEYVEIDEEENDEEEIEILDDDEGELVEDENQNPHNYYQQQYGKQESGSGAGPRNSYYY